MKWYYCCCCYYSYSSEALNAVNYRLPGFYRSQSRHTDHRKRHGFPCFQSLSAIQKFPSSLIAEHSQRKLMNKKKKAHDSLNMYSNNN